MEILICYQSDLMKIISRADIPVTSALVHHDTLPAEPAGRHERGGRLVAHGEVLAARLQPQAAGGRSAARARYVMYVCTGHHPHSFCFDP